jgi:hypothetical protein
MESLTRGQLLDGRLASTLHGLEDKGRISTSYNQPTVSPVERCYELAKLGSLRVKLHGMNGGHPSDIGNPYNRFFESLMVDEHPLF